VELTLVKHAPLGVDHREHAVDDESGEDNACEAQVIGRHHDGHDRDDFDDRRQYREQGRSQQKTDTGGPALNIAREYAGLAAPQMLHAETVQMREHTHSEVRYRGLRDPSEYDIAQFGE